MTIITQGATLHIMTTAERIRALPTDEQYGKAVVWMIRRDCLPDHVVFHFDDGSTLTFKKVYQLAYPVA